MQKQTIYKIYAAALFATSLLLLLFVYLNAYYNGNIWSTMEQSKSALTAEYCELDQSTHFFRQTINTYSNLGYFFLGMMVVLISIYDKKNGNTNHANLLQQFPTLSALFGCCLLYLCFGSSFFNASLTWIGQRADMNATYSICISLIAISSYRLLYKENAPESFKRLLIFIILLIIVGFVQLHLIISSSILLPALVLLVTILTTINYLKNKKNYNIQLAILSLLLMIGAYIIRTIDVMKIACDPTSVFQGHALWHFLTGMSAFFLYWFYRSVRSLNS